MKHPALPIYASIILLSLFQSASAQSAPGDFCTRAFDLLQQDLYDESIAAYELCNDSGAAAAEDHQNFAALFNDLGMYEKAVAAADKGLQLNPVLCCLHLSKGQALYHLGRYEEAIPVLDKAALIGLPDEKSWAYYFKGASLNSLGRYEEAITALDNAITIGDVQPVPEISKPPPVAHILKAEVLNTLGRYDEALAIIDRANMLDTSGEYAQNITQTKDAIMKNRK